MRTILNGLLKKIGFYHRYYENNLTKQLRQEAIRWACIVNSTMCLKTAAIELNYYMANPMAYR